MGFWRKENNIFHNKIPETLVFSELQYNYFGIIWTGLVRLKQIILK